MKKLQSLGRVLSSQEQKRIIGGDDYGGGGGCACNFVYGTTGTCGVRCGGRTIAYGMSQYEAQSIASQCGYYWCCASC